MIVADQDLDAFFGKEGEEFVDRCVIVVIGEEHLGLDDLCGVGSLFDGHRIRLVAGQESDVDVLDIGHLGDVLGVACDVDAHAVEGKDIAVVTTLGVELLASGSGVVGWYGLDGDVVGIFHLVTVLQCLSAAEHFLDGGVEEDLGGSLGQLRDGIAVEVVVMLVGDEDDVGLGELRVVGLGFHALADGIDFDLQAVVVDLDTGMLDACEAYFLTTVGGELVGLLLCLATEGHQACDGCHE